MSLKATLYLLPLLTLWATNGHAQSPQPTGLAETIDSEGVSRSYRMHVPESVRESGAKAPVVFCLHGGGSNAAMMSKAGWTKKAEDNAFIVVYPEGLKGHWNDGRNVRKHAAQNARTDDAAFLMKLLDELIETQPIDPQRVYLVGLSNGGFMVQRLANEHTERFAAVAVQIASLPTTYQKGPLTFAPRAPLSVLFMNGTDDRFMPYDGGKLTPNLAPHLVDSATFDFGQGSAIPTVEAAALWVSHNDLDPATVTVTELPDRSTEDGCRAIVHRWTGPDETLEVVLYEIQGGGHTIPGGAQYLPERIIGPVCQDFDGIQATWEFFESKRR